MSLTFSRVTWQMQHSATFFSLSRTAASQMALFADAPLGNRRVEDL